MAYEHFKYVVEIKQIGLETTTETKEFCTLKEPTELKDNSYGRSETAYKQAFEVRDIPVTRTAEWQVYRQEVKQINLKAVIDAVNSGAAQ